MPREKRVPKRNAQAAATAAAAPSSSPPYSSPLSGRHPRLVQGGAPERAAAGKVDVVRIQRTTGMVRLETSAMMSLADLRLLIDERLNVPESHQVLTRSTGIELGGVGHPEEENMTLGALAFANGELLRLVDNGGKKPKKRKGAQPAPSSSPSSRKKAKQAEKKEEKEPTIVIEKFPSRGGSAEDVAASYRAQTSRRGTGIKLAASELWRSAPLFWSVSHAFQGKVEQGCTELWAEAVAQSQG